MVNAYTPKSLVVLGSSGSAPSKIECIHAYGDKLLLGLDTGTIQVFNISSPAQPDTAARLSATYSDISRRPIEKLAVLKHVGVLAVLTDGKIRLHDADTLDAQDSLDLTKGATTFSIREGVQDNVEDSGSIVVSQLVVACRRKLVWYEWRDSQFYGSSQVNLPDRIKTVTFMTGNKVICGMASAYDIVDLRASEITTSVFPGGLATANQGTFAAYSYIGIGGRQPTPLSVAAGKDKYLLVQEMTCQCIDSDGTVVEDVHLPEFAAAPKSLGYSYPYIICILPKQIEIRNPETMTLIQKHDIPDLCTMNEGKWLYVATASRVFRLFPTGYREQVEALQADGMLEEAISILNQIEPVLIDDKQHMLRDLQILNATRLFKQQQFDEALQLFSDISAPPQTVIGLYPPPLGTSSDDERNAALEGGDLLTKSIRALQPYLADTRRKISTLGNTKDLIQYHGVDLSEEIYGDLLTAAGLVDTTLFRCYLETNPSLVGALVRIHNHCDPDVVEPRLKELGKWRELVDFYFGKAMHRRALELLRRLADDERASNELKGPETTVRYLQRLGNSYMDLIFEFAKWPLTVEERFGEELFMEDSTESHSLAHKAVFEYLQRVPLSIEFCLKYLEYVVSELKDPNIWAHNALGKWYAKTILDKDRDSDRADELVRRFKIFLETSTHYRPGYLLEELGTSERRFLELRAILHGKLMEHKKALRIYAFDMGDAAMARTYCSNLYAIDHQEGKRALHMLLSLYLKSWDKQPLEQPVLDLLHSQGSRMSAREVISTLPTEMKISNINRFLDSHVRSLTTKVNTGRLSTAMLSVDHVKTTEEYLVLGQKHTTITVLRTCSVCRKRLGNSVISLFPDDAVVHYGCASDYKRILETRANDRRPMTLKTYRQMEQ